MAKIEVHSIKKPVIIHVSGDRVVLPSPLYKKIDQHWQKLVKANPRLHNGEVFTVVGVNETEQKIDIELAETNYAHYLYSHQVGGLGELMVRIIHSATLVITRDNKIIFGAMGMHTSRPGAIQCCGGGIDHNDITDGAVNIEGNTVKEIEEELGLNAYDKDLVEEFSPVYFKTGGPRGKMTLIYALRLKLSGLQFMKHYEHFAESLKGKHQEPEFGEIFCIAPEKNTVEAFIKESEDKLNEYMPALLRIAATEYGVST